MIKKKFLVLLFLLINHHHACALKYEATQLDDLILQGNRSGFLGNKEYLENFLEQLKTANLSIKSRKEIIARMIKVLILLTKENIVSEYSKSILEKILPNNSSLQANLSKIKNILCQEILNLEKNEFYKAIFTNNIDKKTDDPNNINITINNEKNDPTRERQAKKFLENCKNILTPSFFLEPQNFYLFVKTVYQKSNFSAVHLGFFYNNINDKTSHLPYENNTNKIELEHNFSFWIIDPFLYLYLFIFDTKNLILNSNKANEIIEFEEFIHNQSKFVFNTKINLIDTIQENLGKYKILGLSTASLFLIKKITESISDEIASFAKKRSMLAKIIINIKKPSVPKNFIVGDEIKNEIEELIEVINIGEKIAEGGVIFYGQPGTGKTSLVNFIAEKTTAKLLTLQPKNLNSPENIDLYFSAAELIASKKNKIILLLDDAEYLLSKREITTSFEKELIIIQMLHNIDEIVKNTNYIYLFATTNFFESIDPAAKRSQRFGKHIEIKNPNKSELQKYLSQHEISIKLPDDKTISWAEIFAFIKKRKQFPNQNPQQIFDAIIRE